MNKNYSLFLIIGSVALIALIVGGSFMLSRFAPLGKTVSLDEATQITLDYLNDNALKDTDLTAELISKEDDPKTGLYKIEFTIEGRKNTAYVSRNGSYLFPQFINMQPKITAIPQTEKPFVRLFVMAFCPYGNQAEDAIIPVAQLLGSKIDFQINYIVGQDQDGQFNSLHGDQELNQDIRELCVENNQSDKFLAFVDGVNKNCTVQDIDQCWQKIAQTLELNEQEIIDCQNNQKDTLLTREMELSGKEYPVEDPSKMQGKENTVITGSPSLVINDVIYTGPRGSKDYLAAICAAFENPPSECQTQFDNQASAPVGNCN